MCATREIWRSGIYLDVLVRCRLDRHHNSINSIPFQLVHTSKLQVREFTPQISLRFITKTGLLDHGVVRQIKSINKLFYESNE